jgi:hypothetical protein
MFQLFHALPRDLQWEVLSLFVGSHSVRKGKLISKIVRDTGAIRLIPRVRTCHIYLYNREYKAKTYACMIDGSQLMYCEDPVTGEAGYTHRRPVRRTHQGESRSYDCQYTPLTISQDVLPPYVKNIYPSYQDTDKKKKERHPDLAPLTLMLPPGSPAFRVPRSPPGPPPPLSPAFRVPRSPPGPPPPL